MRRLLLEKLKMWKNQEISFRKPLVLTGARQIGKTYLLKEFGKVEFEKFHYFNLEENKRLREIFEQDLKPERIIRDLGLFTDKEIERDDLIIFDEIQSCPLAITSLKYFCEDLPKQAICVAGSLLGLELNPGSYPVGKVEYLNMFPMNFREFVEACGDERYMQFVDESLRENKLIPDYIHDHLWFRLKHYFIVGGLPEVVKNYIELKESDPKIMIEKVREIQKNIIRSHLADMAKHAGEENSMHIERLWSNVPAQLSREIDTNVARFQFKNVVPKLNRYSELIGVIHWLDKASLIIKVPICHAAQIPWKAYTKENIFKLYLYDVGILGAMSDLQPESILQYDYGTYKGFFAENFVAQELACAKGTKEHIYSWKENSAEVEFIINQGSNLVPVEVKAGWVTQSKSAKVFLEKYHSPYRMILSANNLHVDDDNKIRRYPLYLASTVV